MNRVKIQAIVTIFCVIIVHLLLDIVYRPWAIVNDISDFGFKHSFTQVTSVIGISLLILLLEKESTWKGRYGKAFLVVVPVVAMLLYEFIQHYIEHSTFDPNDLMYTFVGGLGAYIIHFHVIDHSCTTFPISKKKTSRHF